MKKAGVSIVLPNSLRDPYLFEDVISLQDKINEGVSELDMSKVTFIEPYSMLSLLHMGRNFLRDSGERIRLTNIPITIHQYLHRMDFFKPNIFAVSDSLDSSLLLKRSAFSKRVIEIIEIPNKERESVMVISRIISIFRKRAVHILKFWLSDTIVDFFVTVISELCQNIFEHSLDSGFIAMQTYSVGKENIVRLVISDSGIGIGKSFEQRNDLSYTTPSELIEMALTMPISSKREFGYGLCQVNTIVEKLNGTLFIRSEDASVTALYHKRNTGSTVMFHKNDLPAFNGTQISISLSG